MRTALLVLLHLAVTPVVALTRLVPRRRDRPVRSLWAGNPILTLPIKAASERLLGVEAETLVDTTYHITDRFDHDIERWRSRPIVGKLVPFVVFVWACARFDRLHFFCDRGLLPSFTPRRFNAWELWLYRRLGKQVFFWCYGADVRTRRPTEQLGRFNCCLHCPAPGIACICDERLGDANIETIRRYATAIFSQGDMTHYTPGSINDLYYWPVDLEIEAGARYAPRYPTAGDRPLRVVHAPNHREFKGTQYLIDAVERLRAEGVRIELELVEGRSNTEALEVYRDADVIFDQCLIGHHGYLAQEAMALGKPVMCYIRDPQSTLLEPSECPIINAMPPEIEPTLRRLAGPDRSTLGDIGRRGRRYIERHHTPRRFADRLARAYEQLGVGN